jgi:glutamate formiminotransferase
VRVARECGERIGRELGVPVYFSGDAATRPELVRAAGLRRLQFEGLRDRQGLAVGVNVPEPDAGPRDGPHGTAGATVVLARPPVCHFDVELETSDRALGRRIVDDLRALDRPSADTRAVAACVFQPDENLSIEIVTCIQDPVRVGIETVYRAIEERAREAGVSVRSCVIDGLVPLAAVGESVRRDLPLSGFDAEAQVIESRLAAIG